MAALFYQGNPALTRRFLHSHGYTRNTLRASRFCRGLRQLPASARALVFGLLAELSKANHGEQVYAVDSYPVAVWANCHIKRCRLFPVKQHAPRRSDQASKKRGDYGFKVHLQSASARHRPKRAGGVLDQPISHASLHDLQGLKRLPLDLPEGATLYADKAYKDQHEEWLLQDAAHVRFRPLTRENAKVPLPPGLVYQAHIARQQVEWAFSLLDRQMPRHIHIHALSPQGFLLKLQAAVIALDKLLN